jgi:hypothetical protein
MKNTLEKLTNTLWLTYLLYHTAAVRNGSDGKQYASECTDNFLEYYHKSTSGDMPFNWDLEGAIQNQIRILKGMIECYDKPIVRDKVTNKTRWTV